MSLTRSFDRTLRGHIGGQVRGNCPSVSVSRPKAAYSLVRGTLRSELEVWPGHGIIGTGEHAATQRPSRAPATPSGFASRSRPAPCAAGSPTLRPGRIRTTKRPSRHCFNGRSPNWVSRHRGQVPGRKLRAQNTRCPRLRRPALPSARLWCSRSAIRLRRCRARSCPTTSPSPLPTGTCTGQCRRRNCTTR